MTKKKFNVYIHLWAEYEVEDSDEAFESALADIADRAGMEIMKHEIIQDFDPEVLPDTPAELDGRLDAALEGIAEVPMLLRRQAN